MKLIRKKIIDLKTNSAIIKHGSKIFNNDNIKKVLIYNKVKNTIITFDENLPYYELEDGVLTFIDFNKNYIELCYEKDDFKYHIYNNTRNLYVFKSLKVQFKKEIIYIPLLRYTKIITKNSDVMNVDDTIPDLLMNISKYEDNMRSIPVTMEYITENSYTLGKHVSKINTFYDFIDALDKVDKTADDVIRRKQVKDIYVDHMAKFIVQVSNILVDVEDGNDHFF